MIEHGIESPAFMAKAALVNVPQRQLYLACASLIDHFIDQDDDQITNVSDIVDRLIQVAVTGEYKPSEKALAEAAMDEINAMLAGGATPHAQVNKPTRLTEEDLKAFRDALEEGPEADDPMEGFELDE